MATPATIEAVQKYVAAMENRREALEALKNQSIGTNGNSGTTRQAVITIGNNLATLKTNVDAAKAAKNKLSGTTGERTSWITTLRSKEDQAIASKQKLKNTTSGLAGIIDYAQSQIDLYQNLLNVAKGDSGTISNNLEALSANVDRKESAFQSMLTSVKDRISEIEAAQQKINALKIAAVKQQINERKNKVNQLKNNMPRSTTV